MIKYLIISALIFYLYQNMMGTIKEKLHDKNPPMPPNRNSKKDMGDYVDYEEIKD